MFTQLFTERTAAEPLERLDYGFSTLERAFGGLTQIFVLNWRAPSSARPLRSGFRTGIWYSMPLAR